jgi:hypothetical protein
MADELKPKDEVTILGIDSGVVDFVHHHADQPDERKLGRVIDEGQPLPEGETLFLNRLDGNRFCVSDTFVNKGPAKVNSPQFKKNWDSIFGKQAMGES